MLSRISIIFSVILISTVSAQMSQLFQGLTGDCSCFKVLFNSKSPDLSTLQIDLYDKDGRITFKINANDLLASSRFDKRKPLVVFVHGFMADAESRGSKSISKALVSRGTHNVLALDTGKLLSSNYLAASGYVEEIGNILGAFLKDLSKKLTSPPDIYIIGHSLGAHISGFTGKYMLGQSMPLKRITGLDPAGPCFFRVSSNRRLDKADAKFVDIIHTDAGGFGIVDSIGHMDFFPNGGSRQPGCVLPLSSHIRAWQLFEESIYGEGDFPSIKCNNYNEFKSDTCAGPTVNMGYALAPSTGNYYLKTYPFSPYGVGNSMYRMSLLEQMGSRWLNFFSG